MSEKTQNMPSPETTNASTHEKKLSRYLKSFVRFVKHGVWIKPVFIVFCCLYIPWIIYCVVTRNETANQWIGGIGTAISPIATAISISTWLKVKSFASVIRENAKKPVKVGQNSIALCIEINNTDEMATTSPVGQIQNSDEILNSGVLALLDGQTTVNCEEYAKIPVTKFNIEYQHCLDKDGKEDKLTGRYVIIRAAKLPENIEERISYVCEFRSIMEDIVTIMRNDLITDVHIFFRGPIALSSIVVSTLNNKFKMHFWHYSSGRYMGLEKMIADPEQ